MYIGSTLKRALAISHISLLPCSSIIVFRPKSAFRLYETVTFQNNIQTRVLMSIEAVSLLPRTSNTWRLPDATPRPQGAYCHARVVARKLHETILLMIETAWAPLARYAEAKRVYCHARPIPHAPSTLRRGEESLLPRTSNTLRPWHATPRPKVPDAKTMVLAKRRPDMCVQRRGWRGGTRGFVSTKRSFMHAQQPLQK